MSDGWHLYFPHEEFGRTGVGTRSKALLLDDPGLPNIDREGLFSAFDIDSWISVAISREVLLD
jgi:hypothetical protein